ncbi:MAG TPA: bacillithiol biosynthesis BshC [Thermoanaerobaculia bacterium]|nr:bacillithiol biosynthesis BshC [Thermoanaerobaculia bacterium]
MSEGCIRLPLRSYPGMNPFVLDWLGGAFPDLPRFDPARVAGSESRRRGRTPAFLAALAESNRRWGAHVERELEAWASGETVTLIAGQQVGFAGGPLYTLAKIASLLEIRRRLESEGKRATLFFWLATEDHDYEEVATLHLPVAALTGSGRGRSQLDLLTLRAAPPPDTRAAVGLLPVPEPLIAELLALMDLPRPRWLREGITFRDSFAELLVSIFGSEIVLVDSLLPELRREAEPLFEAILRRWDDVQKAVAADSAELRSRGYQPQISSREEEYTVLFRLDGEGKRRIVARGEAPGDPATLSTSALTRPLLQDYLFAPDVFVGGPAEVAYYAQQRTMHALFEVAMPAVALRGHVLVAPKRTLRAFDRHAIAPQEVFSTAEEVLARREPDGIAEIRSIAGRARRDLAEALTRIGELALPAEHAMARALSRSIGHIEYHFDKLTERAIRALVRKDRERWAAMQELIATFHPDRQVQDRVAAWFPWWCQYGKHLVDRVVEEIEPGSESFKMIGL